MRLGVLDVGSNTVHLLVVDAHHGAHPWPAHSQKERLRLAEQLGPDGELTVAGADALVRACVDAGAAAQRLRVEGLLAFATSAVREASNSAEVLDRVRGEAGVELRVLAGPVEARLTFLAVRRWFGWSAGRILALDIGGGSLEIAAGIDEEPAVALSVPLGAGRLTRNWLAGVQRPASRSAQAQVAALTEYVCEQLKHPELEKIDGFDRAVATSKTFRTLARLGGASPSGTGLWTPRSLTRKALTGVRKLVGELTVSDLAARDGVSASRAHQLFAGALVAEAAMDRLGVETLDICPWALREGIILRHLDELPV
jgi:exopolyphosphatase / guanosine-5'-triphosphate,3'-diphosphate pyrophosphatase